MSTLLSILFAFNRLVYKLTDFGSAREFDDSDNEMFMSMYGTEEYLVSSLSCIIYLLAFSLCTVLFAFLLHTTLSFKLLDPEGGSHSQNAMLLVVVVDVVVVSSLRVQKSLRLS